MSSRAAAAHNNAVWCNAVCRALGHDTTFADGLWLNRDASPPYYSNAVTLLPDGQVAQLRRVREMLQGALPRPWTIKDSYRALDLADMDFDVLFEAIWLALTPGTALPLHDAAAMWGAILDDAGLDEWEAAWRGGNPDADSDGMPRLFQPALLEDPHIRFLAGRRADTIVAVAVANRSDDGTGPVVGISNVVRPADPSDGLLAGAVGAVRDAFPGLPLVGYERGDDLDAMRRLGFRDLAPLRVWITRG